MSIGCCRYAAGQSNRLTVTYDEALVVVNGAFSVTDDGVMTRTAQVGETIFLAKNTRVLYSADEETEIAYVTHPRWEQALRSSEHAHIVENYARVQGGPPDISANG